MPVGPCTVCGSMNYPMSLGGPNICPSCDCGVLPETQKLERRIIKLELKLAQQRQEVLEELAIFMETKFAHPFIAQPERKYIASTFRALKRKS